MPKQKINKEKEKQAAHLQKSLKEASDYKQALDESCIVAIKDQRGIINYANDNFCIQVAKTDHCGGFYIRYECL